MITHCQICKREFWSYTIIGEESPVIPIDPRFCQDCAIKACEQMEDGLSKKLIEARTVICEALGILEKDHGDGYAATRAAKFLKDHIDKVIGMSHTVIKKTYECKDPECQMIFDVENDEQPKCLNPGCFSDDFELIDEDWSELFDYREEP